MAIRVGTTAHDISGLRASSTEHYSWSGATIESISPEIFRPGVTATITTENSAEVALVTFGGISQTFTRPTATTVEFVVPDGYLYGDRPVRVEDSLGGGRTINHPCQPTFGNSYVTLSGYPPGANVWGTQQLHLGEEYSPQPTDGAQIEVWNSDATNDFELYADGTYSLLEDAYLQRRVIYDDADATEWEDVFVNRIPEDSDVVAGGVIAGMSLDAPTGRMTEDSETSGAVAPVLMTAPTATVTLQVNVNASGSIAPLTFGSVSATGSRVVQWTRIPPTEGAWEKI